MSSKLGKFVVQKFGGMKGSPSIAPVSFGQQGHLALVPKKLQTFSIEDM